MTVVAQQTPQASAVDDTPGMVACRCFLHQPVGTVAVVQAEGVPHHSRAQGQGDQDAREGRHAGHVENHEEDEDPQQSPGEDEQVLALEPFELRAAAYPLVDRILRHVTGRMSVRWWQPR